MTPHPQCQYSRTLDEVGNFCIIKDDWVGTSDCEKCPAFHSTAPPASEQEYQDDDCIWMTPEEEEKRIRKHEREKVLDEVREALSHIRYQDEDMWFIEAAIKRIEFLRAQQQQER